MLVVLSAAAGYRLGAASTSDVARRIDLYAAAQTRYTSFVFGSGSPSGNEESLRAYLALLDTRAGERGIPDAYSFDKALALTRLSEIARRHGAAEEAARRSNEAGGLCRATGLANCSANELLRAVRSRDAKIWGDATP